jgi:hypothetical protein
MDALLTAAEVRAAAAEIRAAAAEARIVELEEENARLRYENEMMIRYICSRYQQYSRGRLSCSTEAREARLLNA